MGKTKMIKVYVPGWQLGISSIIINSILAIQPRFIFAQTETNPANVQTATNNNQLTADLEPEILSEINRVRTSPQDYAQWLEQQRQYYDGIWLRLPGEKPVRTNRGKEALEEAIALLKQQKPLPPLEKSSQTAAAATSELENFADANNIQYFSYGKKTASGIVMDLVVDELFPDRRRRQSLLSPEAEDTGVACKPDPRYAKVCAIAYSNSPHTADVAQQPKTPAPPQTATESQPEAVSQPQVKPQAQPEIVAAKEAPAVKTESEAKNNTDTASLPAPSQAPAPPPPAIDAPQPSPEATGNNNNTDTDSLPAPSQPQAPPPAIDDPQPSPETETSEEDLQIAQAESEIEQEQKKLAENQGESATNQESNQSEAVAINRETADFSEKVEEGSLEKGDRVINDDGSLYDFYPIQGKAGESLTIHLESSEFDAFVALVDSHGKTVGENDDISAEDSNSQLTVTLPEDGIYNVIVNTYEQNGTGKYILKVNR